METLIVIGVVGTPIFLGLAVLFWAWFLKDNSRIENLRTISILNLMIGCTIIFIFGSMALVNRSNRDSDKAPSKVADGFTIEKYKVVMDVKESNSIDITEYITVNFFENGKHGIYHFIPTWLQYTDKTGKVLSRKAEISNLKAIGDSYTIEDGTNKRKIIKLGSSYFTMPIGEHTYEIRYTYNFGEDPYENFDELIFHAFGNYWGTQINNASLEIHLPKPIDTNSNIHFFLDKYRKNDVTKYMNYYISNNTIYANVPSNYSLDGALTVDLELPEGYFVKGENTYGYKSFLASIICIVFAIASILLWKKHGKDLNKVPETVEFYPPEQLDAAEIGYIYKKDTGKKLTVALIVELASKGFIKIIESEDKTNITIKKIKSKDTSMTPNEELVYNKLFETSDTNFFTEDKEFYKVFSEVDKNVSKNFDDKINDVVSYKSMFKSSIMFVISTILWGMSYCILEDLNPKFKVLYILSFIAVIVTLLFTILMKRKNLYGEQIIAKISGFKNYIELAEKDQIDALAEKNPNYFYDILPYAYVLDVSKAWIEKFENIPMPTSDGNFDFHNVDSINSLSSSVYYPSPSGSSSSSCGGGCSSCGGGCSSCGGGGSW